ncbi:MAG: TIGR04086 family membrane protein [Clostridiales bacterium]|nr:TIGR04086 family membrane protein [Clostridiales bacterium]
MDKLLARNSKGINFLKSLLIAYIISSLLLFLLAFLMLKLDLSGTAINVGIVVIYILSSFVGGFLMGKNTEKRRFIWGLITGILYFVVLVIISTIMNTFTGMDTSRLLSAFLVCGFSGMLGGMLS